MSEKDTKTEQKVSYKDTLNLPRTDFPIRSNHKENDPKILERWIKEDLFAKSFDCHKGNEKFVLHDGPPYANGHIHIGHAYNKILKDIVCKSKRMEGKQVPVTPGWDCHGLPIELKVSKENPGATATELKKACRKYAEHWINVQREEFKSLGVLMNWNKPYLTMAPKYEADILRAFGDFVNQGYIERKNKTVPWCASCQTVLAAAEIEYQERKDPSIYVLFPLNQESADKILPKDYKGKQVNLLVWTTTPWTLPLNRAVLLKPNAHYVVLEHEGTLFVVGKQLADKVVALLNTEKNIVSEFSSKELEGEFAYHPFIENQKAPIILDDSVLLEDGTACVHSAPGCGPEDYEVGIKNKLEIFSPLSPSGKYTKGIKPEELENMPITDGQIWVLRKLNELGRLLYKTSIRHSYPHCWRCHNGLIFRATKQWFFDLAKGNLRDNVLNAIEDIWMVPSTGKNRLTATLEGRLEWCISRQRVWGVPIPAIICLDCDQVFTSKELVDKVAKGVEKEGIEYWDSIKISDLLPEDFSCKSCNSKNLKKETDILDVWFDSGVSHYAVLYHNPELAFPADMYLEGKDQHRGWFQSSLLTSMALEKEACTKSIVTHGFTVDERGQKMSKSIGNVVSPQEMIDRLGTDGLRLWATTTDLKDDAVISEVLIKNVEEVYRKIRNTCRFLLSNLYDFDIQLDAVSLNELSFIDRYALSELYILNEKIRQGYAECKFTNIFHELADYCAKDLSSFYLDIIKDRLYVDKADGKLRRSAQTVCWHILDTLTKLMAPVLSFTSELISDHYQKDKKESIHLQEFAEVKPLWELLSKNILQLEFYKNKKADDLKYWQELWETLKDVRSAILKAIEEQREKGVIKHPLEAQVTISLDLNKEELLNLFNFLQAIEKTTDQTIIQFFKELLIVSQFAIESSNSGLKESEFKGLSVDVRRAEGDKCPRCWQYEVTEHPDKLCQRCKNIVK